MPTVNILSSNKDGYNVEDATSNNYGSLNIFAGIDTGAVGSGPAVQYHGYLDFDWSSIPANAVISSATLNLYKHGGAFVGASYVDLRVVAVKNSWTEASYPPWSNSWEGDFKDYGDPLKRITNVNSVWVNFDVTKSVQAKYSGNPFYGFKLQFAGYDGSFSRAYAIFSSRENGAPYYPQMTVTYNLPPSAPTVTSPNGGETIDKTSLITWTPSTDSDTAQSSLRYQVQLTTDNGATWKDLIALTATGATSLNYDFTNETESATARIRVRAYDGALYGSWDESNNTFSIVHNVAPSAPVITSPNGGETLDKTHSITWQAATDADGNPLQYHIQLTTNNGSTWKDVVALTSGTSYSYDFTNETETSLGKIRVRAYDGKLYGSWDESNGVFTISHNVAPLQPSNLYPNGQVANRQLVNRFSWKHNDTGEQSAFELHWKLRGANDWIVVTQNTNNQYYDFGPNVFPLGEIDWEVRTTDNGGLVSPWSNTATFTSAEPSNAPTITAPIGTVAISKPIIQWVSADQKAYQIIIKDGSAAIVWDSGEVTSVNKAVTSGIDLLNGATYIIELRTKNTAGLWTSYGTVTINVSYTPPTKPIVTTYEGASHLIVEVGNPEPTGTQPSVTGNDIYKLIDGEYVKIATGIFYQYRDYQINSGVTHQYFVRAIGDNGTFTDSEMISGSTSFESVWLHVVSDPINTIYNFTKDIKRDNAWSLSNTKLKFKGRKRLVIETDEMTEEQMDFTLIANSDEMKALERLIKSQEVVCYRDGRGRKINGVFTNVKVSDESSGSFTVDLSLDNIDYKEGE